MRKHFITGVLIITAGIIGAFLYYKSHISVWGFILAKKELKSVIIYTDKKTYTITNKEMVLELVEEFSKMKKVDISKKSIKNASTGYRKLFIKANKTTYGGKVLNSYNGSSLILQCNGVYWEISPEVLSGMDQIEL